MSKGLKHLLGWTYSFVLSIFVLVLIVWFGIQGFVVKSGSMEETLIEGDYLIAEKITYGARLPITPFSISWANINNNWFELDYHRLPGTGKVKRDDILIFNNPLEENLPIDRRTVFSKRCIGLPGDTILIEKNEVHIDGKRMTYGGFPKTFYHVRVSAEATPEKLFEQLKIRDYGKLSNQEDWLVSTHAQNALLLKQDTAVRFIAKWTSNKKKKKQPTFTGLHFPKHPSYLWNATDFGPIWIPQKGKSIALDTNNLPLYKRIIETYEGNALSTEGDQIYINQKQADQYTFRLNYYFVMGDHREDSSDSRHWGFVPEDHLIGRAVLVLISFPKPKSQPNQMRWDRLFKFVE